VGRTGWGAPTGATDYSGRVSDTTPKPAPRSPDQIESDLAATRDRLASTIDSLHERVKPENIAKQALGKVKGVYIKPGGGIRVERVAATAVAVVGLVLVSRGLNSLRQRRMPDVVWVPVPRDQMRS